MAQEICHLVCCVDNNYVPHCGVMLTSLLENNKGERIRVQIAGRYIREGWFEPLAWDTDNHGNHIIHTGGQYESFLQVPMIPTKYDYYMDMGFESN